MTEQRRVKRGWMNLKVTDIYDETHDTKTFYLVDADDGGRPYDFVAGQYLTFRFDNVGPKPIVRSYTMSGSPCQTDYSIFTVKRIPNGLISNWLCDSVKVGDVLRARGPIGMFVYNPQKDLPNLFMVAGGSGVTPFISIIREYQNKLGQPNCPSTLNLLVAYRTKDDLICWKEIEEARRIPGVNIYVTLTRDHHENEGFWYGRPESGMMEKFFAGQYTNATVMSCGPQAIMDLARHHALSSGIAEAQVKTESFES
jgi:ferredoxin-NADP reductase